MSDMRAGYGVLGPVQLTIDGVAQPLGGVKQRAVLAYLVVNANRPVSTEALAQAVWEENPPPDIRISLHTIVSNLRKPLRDAGLDARTILSRAGTGYRIAAPADSCDVQRFRARRESGLRAMAAGRFSVASEVLSSALDQWRGTALADLQGLGFADAFATALDDERIGAVEARAQAEIAQGRADGVIAELAELADRYPLREPLWEQLITALYVNGRQSDALEALRRLRVTLADELGIDPVASIRELEAKMLRQEPLTPPADAVASALRATTVVDLIAPESQAYLRDSRGQTFPITSPFTRIGRLPDNDIVLDDGKVSRHHAVIVSNGVTCVLKDLLSSNGVFVGGIRVIDGAALTDGVTIRIGTTEFTFGVMPPN
ncbi:BTAD domain-containing putative transcriptional regulator [Nocardia sp. NPDC050408]|uniref:BTAD domain-containing putative transcriptional regulator n=1 Tax=Nocardia sp. NPDC050408 TaxID=3364319 RepID=UPI0037B913CB